MKIVMTKGDIPTFAFQAFLPDGSEYEFEAGDSVVFAAKQSKYDNNGFSYCYHLKSVTPPDTVTTMYSSGMTIQILYKTNGNRKTGYVDYFAKMNKTPVVEKVG